VAAARSGPPRRFGLRRWPDPGVADLPPKAAPLPTGPLSSSRARAGAQSGSVYGRRGGGAGAGEKMLWGRGWAPAGQARRRVVADDDGGYGKEKGAGRTEENRGRRREGPGPTCRHAGEHCGSAGRTRGGQNHWWRHCPYAFFRGRDLSSFCPSDPALGYVLPFIHPESVCNFVKSDGWLTAAPLSSFRRTEYLSICTPSVPFCWSPKNSDSPRFTDDHQ
jgi:hypothetical protein